MRTQAEYARGAFHNANTKILMEIHKQQKANPTASPERIKGYVMSTLGVALGGQLQITLIALGAPHDIKVYPTG